MTTIGTFRKACENRSHRKSWWVHIRRANFSAFNGYRRTPSAYSEVRCGTCGARWRTKAVYVDTLPNDPSRRSS